VDDEGDSVRIAMTDVEHDVRRVHTPVREIRVSVYPRPCWKDARRWGFNEVPWPGGPARPTEALGSGARITRHACLPARPVIAAQPRIVRAFATPINGRVLCGLNRH